MLDAIGCKAGASYLPTVLPMAPLASPSLVVESHGPAPAVDLGKGVGIAGNVYLGHKYPELGVVAPVVGAGGPGGGGGAAPLLGAAVVIAAAPSSPSQPAGGAGGPGSGGSSSAAPSASGAPAAAAIAGAAEFIKGLPGDVLAALQDLDALDGSFFIKARVAVSDKKVMEELATALKAASLDVPTTVEKLESLNIIKVEASARSPAQAPAPSPLDTFRSALQPLIAADSVKPPGCDWNEALGLALLAVVCDASGRPLSPPPSSSAFRKSHLRALVAQAGLSRDYQTLFERVLEKAGYLAP